MDDRKPTGDAPADSLPSGLAAAIRQQYMQGARTFLRSMARLLETTLPGAVQIKRRGLLGGHERFVRRIEVLVPEATGGDATRYTLEHLGRGPIAATRTRLKNGAAGATGTTETIAVEGWIQAVSAALTARAQQSRDAHDALRRFLSER